IRPHQGGQHVGRLKAHRTFWSTPSINPKPKGQNTMNKTSTKSRSRISDTTMQKFSGAKSAPEPVTPTAKAHANGSLDADLLRKIDAWWRAANYLSVGQTYLYDNPLLRQPLKKEHVKPRLVGHWGTTPGLNF